MCGIVGQVRKDRAVAPDVFARMRDSLVHRGPDGAGTEVLANGRVALGHRRLSILDLSEAGRQPMTNEDGTLWLTFNGEIYNFAALRRPLLEAGHRFGSETDSEVLLHGYEEWGLTGLLERLKGMFAFALYDGRSRELHLARDRFGIKPLVYYQDGRQFSFASEIKALLEDPSVPRSATGGALEDYFIYSYVPTPRTIYKDIFKLEPATCLTLELSTWRAVRRKYWEPERGDRSVTREEAAEELAALFRDSVREHLVSDVPVGVLLSGGYDSTSVLRYAREAGADPDTFTLGFGQSEKSEHRVARDIARTLGARPHERVLDGSESYGATIRELARHYDEPYGITSQVTYHYVSELAAKTHKVVLAGDGGDEILAGYTWYKRLTNLAFTPRTHLRFLLGRTTPRREFLREYDRGMTGAYKYLGSRSVVSPDFLGRMRERAFGGYDEHLASEFRDLKNIQSLDIRTYLLDNCLYRGDMSSMLHSLEVRIPLLDHKILEFIFSLRPGSYFDPEHPKALLRRGLEGKIPAAILDRPKQGFGLHHREQLLTPEYEDLINHGELRKLGLLNGKVDVRTLNVEIAFHLIYLEYWLQNHSL